MSAPQLYDSTPAADRPFTFKVVPLLRELLPKQHGRPGLIYAQIHVANQRRAQDQGWKTIEGTAIYTIVGPKGSADMVLMGKGKPLVGVGHSSGKRRCVVDLAVEQLTGHRVKSTPLNTTVATPTNGAPNAVEQSRHEATQAPQLQAVKGKGSPAQG